ncbi:MAG: hypothetical protein Kow0069_39430 [Promethearchaeota archaeon]
MKPGWKTSPVASTRYTFLICRCRPELAALFFGLVEEVEFRWLILGPLERAARRRTGSALRGKAWQSRYGSLRATATIHVLLDFLPFVFAGGALDRL